MAQKVFGFHGFSGSGKTTLICNLIRHFAISTTVGAIKHTHHPAGGWHSGDSEKFLDAGARQAILAGNGKAVLKSSREGMASNFDWTSPADLVERLDTSLILIEGFKTFSLWPAILTTRSGNLDGLSLVGAVAVVSPIPLDVALPHFLLHEVAELANFLAGIVTDGPYSAGPTPTLR